MTTIAVDAMGGDTAPRAEVRTCVLRSATGAFGQEIAKLVEDEMLTGVSLDLAITEAQMLDYLQGRVTADPPFAKASAKFAVYEDGAARVDVTQLPAELRERLGGPDAVGGRGHGGEG